MLYFIGTGTQVSHTEDTLVITEQSHVCCTGDGDPEGQPASSHAKPGLAWAEFHSDGKSAAGRTKTTMKNGGDRQTMCALKDESGQEMEYRERQPTNLVVLIQVDVSYIPIRPRLHYNTLRHVDCTHGALPRS